MEPVLKGVAGTQWETRHVVAARMGVNIRWRGIAELPNELLMTKSLTSWRRSDFHLNGRCRSRWGRRWGERQCELVDWCVRIMRC
jgi:hypothetical protein